MWATPLAAVYKGTSRLRLSNSSCHAKKMSTLPSTPLLCRIFSRSSANRSLKDGFLRCGNVNEGEVASGWDGGDESRAPHFEQTSWSLNKVKTVSPHTRQRWNKMRPPQRNILLNRRSVPGQEIDSCACPGSLGAKPYSRPLESTATTAPRSPGRSAMAELVRFVAATIR